MASEFGDEVVPLHEIIRILKLGEDDVVLSIGDLNGYYSLVFRKYAKEVHVLLPEDIWFQYVKRLSAKFGAKNVIPNKGDACMDISVKGVNKFFIKTREISLECLSKISNSLIKDESIKSGIALGVHSPPFLRPSDLPIEPVENAFKNSGFGSTLKINFRYHYVLYVSK